MTFRDVANACAPTFNVENELASVVNNGSTTSFTYDAAGIRVKTVRPGGKSSYFPFPGYEEEVNGSTITRRITYSVAGQAVALRVQVVGGSNTLYYLHIDHLGSTSLATTTGGAVVAGSTARYYPFGDWRTEPTASDPNGSPLTDRGFTGHLHNNIGNAPDDIGLVYMQARWYLPGLARFISADTIIPNPANPQSYNRYSYVENRPLTFRDPTGHISCTDSNLPGDDQQACIDTTEPIWTRSFIDNPDWVQYYGPTEFAKGKYTSKVHSGLDQGRYAEAFGSTGWNRDLDPEWHDFDGTYGTESRPLIPVYAGCYCTVDTNAELHGPVGVNAEGKPNSYAPERVNLRSNHEFYEDWLLIYGHLMDIQVSPGQSVTPDTVIGYLETTEIHVHVEIRKPDNSYINPFPYLSPDLQAQMYSFQGGGVRTTYRPGFSSDPYNQKPGGY